MAPLPHARAPFPFLPVTHITWLARHALVCATVLEVVAIAARAPGAARDGAQFCAMKTFGIDVRVADVAPGLLLQQMARAMGLGALCSKPAPTVLVMLAHLGAMTIAAPSCIALHGTAHATAISPTAK